MSESPRFYESVVGPDVVGPLADLTPQTSLASAGFTDAVAAEYHRLGQSATRRIRLWRRLRTTVLILVAPIAPLALTGAAWIAAILGALITVVEGVLALWNFADTARAEMKTANQLEQELLRYTHRLPPYAAGTEEHRMSLFVDAVARAKEHLSTDYLRTLDSSIAAAKTQAGGAEQGGASGSGIPTQPPRGNQEPSEEQDPSPRGWTLRGRRRSDAPPTFPTQ